MRRQRNVLAALALALLAAFVPAAGAQSGMNATWTLDRDASDNVAAAINTAVARMNFVVRPIARGRLTRTNTPYQRVVLNLGGAQNSVTFDSRPAIVTPSDGTSVKWTRDDGEVLDVSTRLQGGRLEQVFAAEDGRRVNSYSLSEDGRVLTMQVTITSPRLAQPLTYRLVYNRAG